MSEVRSPRRRRSVAVAPALLDPAELPEDAAGRVALINVEAPNDIVGTPGFVPPTPQPGTGSSILSAGDGWIIVGVAGAVIVVLFVIGMLLTR